MADPRTLHQRIDDEHGEWWHQANGDTYHELADRLVRLGVTEDDAVDILLTALNAAADEYGG